jgi:uncharacterized DUF497 family protein
MQERLVSIGASAHGQILLAVHTERYEAADLCVIRLISCQRATAGERKTYEED